MRVFNPLNTIALAIVSTILSACGGDKSTAVVTPAAEPIQIGASSWNKNQVLSRSINPVTITTTEQLSPGLKFVTIEVKGINLGSGDHWQIHLDTDNDANTGFKFDGEAWAGKSGIDLLIEDGAAYKSTTNDSSWGWKSDRLTLTKKTANSLKVRVGLNSLGLCKKFNVGVITLDKDWNIKTFHPAANKMLAQEITFCDVPNKNQPPKITIKGADPMTAEFGSVFVDPGATASDKEDGDLSSKIITTTNVDTSKPCRFCTVRYTVTDSGGLTITKFRRVIVKEKPYSGITVDGIDTDWNTIDVFTENRHGTIKVKDDKDYLYVLVKTFEPASKTINSQLYIDTDNSAKTGFTMGANSADYLVENDDLNKFIGKVQYQWAWKYNSAQILNASTGSWNGKTWEIGIPKSAMHNLGNKIALGYTKLDSNWNARYRIPLFTSPNIYLKTFTLEVPVGTKNKTPIAVDDDKTDGVIGKAIKRKVIDVLKNDSDPDGDVISVVKADFVKPKRGTAEIMTDGKILYKLTDPYYRGTDSFKYRITDGHGKFAVATVTVKIWNNSAPKALDDVATVDISKGKSVVIDVLKNDTDPNNDPLTIHKADYVAPKHGTVTIVNKKIRYTAKNNFTGVDTFKYRVFDGITKYDSATVTVNVSNNNHAPDAVEDAPETGFHTPILIRVLDNDTDPDGDTLSVLSITQPAVGTATLNADGTVLFDPKSHVGSHSFAYTVSDGRGGTDIAEVTIATYDPNDQLHAGWPTINNDTATVKAGKTVMIDVLANDSDPDGDPLNLDQIDDPAHGSIVKTNSKIIYTADSGYIGTDVFYYGAHDGHGHNGAGKVTVTITQ